MRILLTGSTGFLGSEVLELLEDQGEELILLSRSTNKRPLPFNTTFIRCSLDNESDIDELIQDCLDVDVIIHMAGLYDLEKSYADHYLSNVVGTLNIVKLANNMKSLKKFIHISSIGICGNFDGEFLDKDFDKGQNFDSNYEKTKFLSEKIVREQLREDICRTILRPGIITASEDGIKIKRDGPYLVYDLLKKAEHIARFMPLIFLPYDKSAKLPLVSLDYVAQAIVSALYEKQTTTLECRFLIPSHSPMVEEILKMLLKNLGHKGIISPIKSSLIPKKGVEFVGLPKDLLKYCYSKTLFTNSSDDHLFDFSQYKSKFIESLESSRGYL